MQSIEHYYKFTKAKLFNLIGYDYLNKDVRFDQIYESRKLTHRDYLQEISTPEIGNNIIKKYLDGGDPLMVSRIGSGELRCISNYLYNKSEGWNYWSRNVMDTMFWLGGLFPMNEKSLNRFSEIFLNSIRSIDILGVWMNPQENSIVNDYCPNAKLIPLRSIEPYYYEKPWSTSLEGKTVLVVHPFEDSILNQYQNQAKIFTNFNVLPKFKLKTIKAPQTFPGHQSNFGSWFEALDSLKEEIGKQDFDVAIVGAGPYGLPISAFIKEMGKQVIHMGGATQILFGIKGTRWDNMPEIKKMYNSYWNRPMDHEVPKNSKRVESGCYW